MTNTPNEQTKQTILNFPTYNKLLILSTCLLNGTARYFLFIYFILFLLQFTQLSAAP